MIFHGIYPQGLKTYVHIESSTQMCITALSIIVPNSKQSRGSSIGERIDKLWNIQIMEYQHQKEILYQALKRHGRVLNVYYEVKSQSGKTIYLSIYSLNCMLSIYSLDYILSIYSLAYILSIYSLNCMILWKRQTMEPIKRSAVAGWGGEREEQAEYIGFSVVNLFFSSKNSL